MKAMSYFNKGRNKRQHTALLISGALGHAPSSVVGVPVGSPNDAQFRQVSVRTVTTECEGAVFVDIMTSPCALAATITVLCDGHASARCVILNKPTAIQGCLRSEVVKGLKPIQVIPPL